ncbi:hypothetical protein CPC08DRAFT_702352 [Agrocybe pediades]|nr:hypothetical protein CPC08DRAFT_702352 [Agrocybe pediades]
MELWILTLTSVIALLTLLSLMQCAYSSYKMSRKARRIPTGQRTRAIVHENILQSDPRHAVPSSGNHTNLNALSTSRPRDDTQLGQVMIPRTPPDVPRRPEPVARRERLNLPTSPHSQYPPRPSSSVTSTRATFSPTQPPNIMSASSPLPIIVITHQQEDSEHVEASLEMPAVPSTIPESEIEYEDDFQPRAI